MTDSNMKPSMPREFNPIHFVRAGQMIAGQLLLSDLPRLQEIICRPNNKPIVVSLEPRMDKEERRYIQGHISTDIALSCQRCNEPVSYVLELSPCLMPVINDGQAKQVPEEYEPLVTHGELVALVDLVEEEILLGLPMVAKHDEGCCPIELPQSLLG